MKGTRPKQLGVEQLTQTFYSRIPNSPAYSIGIKTREQHQLLTPGPGQYTPVVPFKASPRAIMGGSKDSFYKISNSPGPGRYEQLSQTSQAFKFPQEKRNLQSYSAKTPGPGEYNNQQQYFAPAFVIPKASRKIKTISNQAGPGQYYIPSLLRSDIGFKMPRGQRKQKVDKIPGPGEYSFSETKRKRGIKIGTGPRLDKSLILGPGPADYSPRLLTDNSPRAVFGTAPKVFLNQKKSPGPGDYELPQSRSVSFSFPKQQTQIPTKPSTPFSYINDYSSLRKTSMSFGKAQKDRLKAEIIPGPGQYEIESFFRKKLKDLKDSQNI